MMIMTKQNKSENLKKVVLYWLERSNLKKKKKKKKKKTYKTFTFLVVLSISIFLNAGYHQIWFSM